MSKPTRLLLLAGAVVLGGGLFWLLQARSLRLPAEDDRSHLSELPVVEQSPLLPARPGDLFTDVTDPAGLDFVHCLVDGTLTNIIESLGSGAATGDFDGDGWLDLYFLQGGWSEELVEGPPPELLPANRLYRNRGNGTFEDVTRSAGVGDTGFGLGAVTADYDGDGDLDLYVCNVGPNRLYRNRGDGTFEEVSGRAGVADPSVSAAATFFDFDGDSDLDLYVANYLTFDPDYDYYYNPDAFPPPLAYEAQADRLYRNRGDGTFDDVTEAAGIDRHTGRGMSVVSADFDDDGHTDVFVSNDATANFLWHNRGDGTFEETALPLGLAFGENGEATAAMTADLGDYDRDGRLDLFVTDTAFSSLYRRDERGFLDQAVRSNIALLTGQYASWGGGYLDFDHDGDLDLFVVNGDLHHLVGWEDLLLRNEGDGTFSGAADASVYFEQKMMGRGAVIADLDNDGDLDVVVTNLNDRPVLLRNEQTSGSWLTVTLRGVAPNSQGLGSRVTLEVGDRRLVAERRCPTGYLSCGDPRLHFGLGDAERVDRIEVVWPDGQRRVLEKVPARQHLTIEQTGL